MVMHRRRDRGHRLSPKVHLVSFWRKGADAGPTGAQQPVLSPDGQRRRRNSPPDFFASGAGAGAATRPSSPNALALSRTSRSAGAERAAPTTIGMPSLTALR